MKYLQVKKWAVSKVPSLSPLCRLMRAVEKCFLITFNQHEHTARKIIFQQTYTPEKSWDKELQLELDIRGRYPPDAAGVAISLSSAPGNPSCRFRPHQSPNSARSRDCANHGAAARYFVGLSLTGSCCHLADTPVPDNYRCKHSLGRGTIVEPPLSSILH